MGKTKEQILNEQKIEIETKQLPSKLQLEKLESLKDVITSVIPINIGFDEQKWQSVWNDDELEILKHKILSIVRDL